MKLNKKQKRGRHSVEQYDIDELYEEDYSDSSEDRAAALGDPSITHYRMKTVRSGEMLESEIYPVWTTSSNFDIVPPAIKMGSRKAQRNLNRKNSVKMLTRLINANFTAGVDTWGHLTYDDEHLPGTIDAANRILQNFIRRLKYSARRRGYPELKYIYITEGGGKTRIHHHIVTNYPDRDEAERLWTAGQYPRFNRLRDDMLKFKRLGNYLGKARNTPKRFYTSLNIRPPKVTVADTLMTREEVRKLTTGALNLQARFESRYYKQYDYIEHEVRYSKWVTGAYIYITMRRRQC